MLRRIPVKLLLMLSLSAMVSAQSPPAPVWKFAVSGDSRNCGDIVMPAIAASVLQSEANFYWHLGDFRFMYDFDEDMVPPAQLHLDSPHVSVSDYLTKAWPDFLDHQIRAFEAVEVFLGIGNHDVVYPKTRDDYCKAFATYLTNPKIAGDHKPRTYYHWVMKGIDFISLDNASAEQFDDEQIKWIESVIRSDRNSKEIKTIVVGMHKALPGSIGQSHSMCESPHGITSGRQVYELLWQAQQSSRKKIYVLASHSHFYLEDVFRTDYWKGQVLAGWIVGTAGAVRYRLPPTATPGPGAKTDVYGYLLGTVMTDGSISFEFQQLGVQDLLKANAGKAESLVHWCYDENKNQTIPPTVACLLPQ